MGQAILVFGIGVGDVGLAFLQFGLAELDDGAKTKIVAGLRKLQGQSGLLPQCTSLTFPSARTGAAAKIRHGEVERCFTGISCGALIMRTREFFG